MTRAQKKKSGQRLSRLKKNAKRLAAYSAAAAATIMTTQDRSAEAEEVVWDIPDITTNVNSLNFFMETGVASTTSNFYGPNNNYGLPFSTQGRFRLVGHVNGFGNNAYIYAPTSNSGFVGSAYAATYNGVNRLAAGDSVAATNIFAIDNYAPAPNNWFGTMYAGSNASSYWQPGDRGFVGIKFELADGTHFGWAEISRVSPDSQEVTLHAFGYNDTPDEPSVIPTGGPVTVTPDSVTPTRGQYVAGDAASLGESDNVDYQMRRSIADIQSRTEFVVKSTSPTATPTIFEFTLEGAVFARSNVVQTIELFDYVAGDWVLVDTSNAARSPAPDSVVTAAGTGDLSRFVEAGTMSIEARIHFQSDSPRQQFASNTDQAVWTIE